MAFSKYNGIFEPTDLGILQRVFDRLYEERRLARKDRDQRERLACEVIEAFNNGFPKRRAFGARFQSSVLPRPHRKARRG